MWKIATSLFSKLLSLDETTLEVEKNRHDIWEHIIPSRVTEQMQIHLDAPFSTEEITQALQ